MRYSSQACTIFLLFAVLQSSFAQQDSIVWLEKFRDAIEVAKEQNKLIVLDFTASWCIACPTMDDEVWSQSEIVNMMKDFVPLRLNADKDIGETMFYRYNLEALPAGVVLDRYGSNLLSWNGFAEVEEILDILVSFPSTVAKIYATRDNWENNKNSPDITFSVGQAYQTQAEDITSYGNRAFLQRSTDFFKRAKQISNSKVLRQRVDLMLILNRVYLNQFRNSKQLLKKLPKEDDVLKENQTVYQYVLTISYLAYGIKDQAKKSFEKLKTLPRGDYFSTRVMELLPRIQDYYYIE